MSTQINQDHIPYCPKCNYKLDAFTEITKNTIPSEGDVSICLGCITTLVFTFIDNNLFLRIPTSEEKLIFDSDPKIIRIKKAIYESDIKNKLTYDK